MIISAAFAAEQAAHAAHGSIFQDPTFWVGLAFCLTVLVLAKPVGRFLSDALQARSDGIAEKLNEAKKLRDEAQALLAEYRKKHQEVRLESEALLQKAKDNAESIRAQAQEALEKDLKKREELALNRLAGAKAQAMDEVRDLAVEIALKTTEKILKQELSGEKGKELILEQIDALPALLSKEKFS